MKTLALILSLALLALAFGFAGRERAGALRAEAQLAHAREAREALEASIRRAAADRARSIAASDRAGGAALAAVKGEAPAEASDPATATKDAARAKLRGDYLESYRDALDVTMALLFARLHLTPSQEDALKDLLAQREANNLRMEDLTQVAGLEDSSQDPTLNALDEQLSQQNKDAMAQLLGYRGERAVNAFLKEKNVMPMLEMIGTDAAAADAPLSQDQAQGVLDLLAGASQKSESGRVLKDTVDWGQVEARAATVLSPVQQSALQGVRADQEAQDSVRRMVVALNGQPAGLGP